MGLKLYVVCGVSAMFIGLISFFAYTNHSLNKELAITKEKLAECNISIEVQNKAIERLRLDTESFKQNIEKEKASIKARYEKLTNTESHTCEAKLHKIDEALHLFYQRNQVEF